MALGALIFMPALVGAVVLGFVFLLFACNYYLNVLESTGAGAKEIAWVSEPILDNAWKLAYLGWLVGLWFGPAYFIGRAVTGNASPWLTLAIPMMVLWLCFPVSQLSSLSASSMWIPLVPDVFARLIQKPGVVLVFLALSAATLALLAVGLQWAFFTRGQWELLFVGAPMVVIAGLLYARVLGRLAFAMRFTTGLFATKRRKKPKPGPEREPEPAPPPVQATDLPPLNSPDGELVGYNMLMADDAARPPKKRVRAEVAEPEPRSNPATEVASEDAPPPVSPSIAMDGGERQRLWTDEDEERTAYGVKEAEVIPEEDTPRELVEPSAVEMALLNRDDAPKKPRRVWGPELFAFLGQPGTISAIIIASGFCFALGVMIRVAREFNPVGGGG